MAGSRALLLAGVAPLLLGVLGGVLYPYWQRPVEIVPVLADPDCNPVEQFCTVQTPGGIIGLQITGPLKALQAFPVEVRLNNIIVPPERVSVRFEMVAMDMGSNHFVLQPTAESWQGQAVLPVCSAGRQDWLATVEVVGTAAYAARFALTVR